MHNLARYRERHHARSPFDVTRTSDVTAFIKWLFRHRSSRVGVSEIQMEATMTMQSEESSTVPSEVSTTDVPTRSESYGAGSETREPDARDKVGAAKDETAAVAQSAAEAGKEVVHEAAAQVSVVATEAKDQLGAMLGQVKDEIKSQVESGGQQAASGLLTLSTQLSALSQGRPDEAGRVGAMVEDAQRRIQAYAETLQQRGPQAVVDDLSAFARRRPGMFLLAATAGGFAIGRLVRGGAALNKEQSGSPHPAIGWDQQRELAAEV